MAAPRRLRLEGLTWEALGRTVMPTGCPALRYSIKTALTRITSPPMVAGMFVQFSMSFEADLPEWSSTSQLLPWDSSRSFPSPFMLAIQSLALFFPLSGLLT